MKLTFAILTSLFLHNAAFAAFTFVGGYDDLTTQGNSSGLLGESATGNLGTVTDGSVAVTTGSANKWANNVGNGSSTILTISNLTQSTTKTALYSFNVGSGGNIRNFNFSLDTTQGLNNASLIMEFSDVNNVIGTSTISGLNLSGDLNSIIFGYQRNSSDGGGNGHLYAMTYNGETYSEMLFGAATANFGNQNTNSINLGSLTGPSNVGATEGDFTINNAYWYILGADTALKNGDKTTAEAMLKEAYGRVIPEPSSVFMSLLGLAGLSMYRRRR